MALALSNMGFKHPYPTAPREEWERAISAMNGITFTVDQLDRGYGASTFDTLDEMPILHQFCEMEGLHPVDVAAQAILFRWKPVMDAGFEGGIDIWEGSPSYAEEVGLRQLSVEELLY